MAGTIFGLPLSIQIDDNGDPLAFCKLYIYAAGTSTPAITYEDFGLTVGLENSFPMVADAAGRIPQFWVDDGSYRARLVSATGDEIFDISSVTAIGASSGTGGGGGGVSDTALIQTGDFIWNPVSGTRTGFVRANGRTIGSTASGATERASSDAEDLFLFLWNNFSDSLCAVSSGRGLTAAADWAANKTIATLDMRGRGPAGLDTMGNSAASVVAVANYTNSETAGGVGGASIRTLTQDQFPNVSFTVSGTAATHTHTGTTSTETGTHTHTGSGTTTGQSQSHTHSYTDRGDTTGSAYSSSGGQTPADDTSGSYTTGSNSVDHTHNYSFTSSTQIGTHTHTITTDASGALALTGTAASGGSGNPIFTLSPVRFGTWYIKL